MKVAFSLSSALDDILHGDVRESDVAAIISTTAHRTIRDAQAGEPAPRAALIKRLWPRILQPRLIFRERFCHSALPVWADVHSIQAAFAELDRRNDLDDPLYMDTMIPTRMAHIWSLQQESTAR